MEHCIRDELNFSADRRIAVLDPVKVVIENYPEGKVEYFEQNNNPNKENAGTRPLPFTREIWIERGDFRTEKVPKFHRLYPDNEVRLMGSYIIKCTGYETDQNGEVTLIRAVADLQTGGKNPDDGRKIKGTIHWLSVEHSLDADVFRFGRLFSEENLVALPEGKTYSDYLDPDSKVLLRSCKLELSLANAKPGDRFQFVRNGYFCKDTKYANTFNSIVDLKESKSK